MRAVKLTGTLRVSEEGELEGLDIHEHGAPNYHWDFGGSGYSLPTPDTSHASATAVKAPDKVS